MSQAEEKRVAQILRKCPVLVDAPADVLAKLAAASQTQSYRARQVVYLPGDRAASVHFIASGRVKVSKVTRDGKELTLAYRTAGEFFGEMAILNGRPTPEQRPRWERVLDFAQRRWNQPVMGMTTTLAIM